MFPNNHNNISSNSNATNVRKPVTKIQNPYAKKRPRPNPTTAPVATINRAAPPAVINNQNPNAQRPSSQHPAPIYPHRPPTATGRKCSPTATTELQRSCGSIQHQVARLPTAAGRNYNNASAPSLTTVASSSIAGRNPYVSLSQSHRHSKEQGTQDDSSLPFALDEAKQKDSNSKQQQSADASNANKRDSLDSLGDSSIDWDEAIRVIDSNSAAATASQNQQQQLSSRASSSSASPGNPVHANKTATMSSPVVDLTQDDNVPTERMHHTNAPSQLGTNVTRSVQENCASSASSSSNNYDRPAVSTVSRATMKPPPVPTALRNNMASLRPSVWSNSNANTNTANASSSRTAGTTQGRQASPQLSQQFLSQQGKLTSSPAAAHKHPMVSTLPTSLQFSPDSIRPVQDDYKTQLVRHANISKPLANGWTLFDHQKKAILKALAMRRFVLALDMGLGKTLIGCVWARAFHKTFENCQIIVICPVSLKQEWTRTATEATELQVEADESKPKPKKKKGDKKRKAEEETTETNENSRGPQVQIYSWAKVPTSVDSSVDNYVVVCDEAHSLQSMQAARTKDLLTLVQPKRCVGVLLLTGTPMST